MGIIERIGNIWKKEPDRIIPRAKRDGPALDSAVFDQDSVRGASRKNGAGEMLEKDGADAGKAGRGSQVGVAETSGVARAPVRDPGKRQRIFVVSALIVVLVFGLKMWQREDWEVDRIILFAASASVLTVAGLAWAFRFEIDRRGYLTVLPQSAMFVFGYVLFVEMFFFQRFERIYEAVAFAVLLIVFMLVLGIVFLTANVLNVAIYKKIPLLQVAQTSSYAITLFNVFFLSFFVVQLGLNIGLTVVLLFIVYMLAVFLHLSHFSLHWRTVRLYSAAISLCAAVAAWVSLFWPVDTLFIVLLPTVVVYIGIGIVMHDVRKALRPLVNWEYFVIVLIVLIVLLSRAVWGIGGYVWS